VEWLLFLSVWFAYGILINSGNLNAFKLQHAAVEAYVERGHFYLEGSRLPQFQFQPVVDVFLYNEHQYPAKQPGQFMAGACAYLPLHALGVSYAGHYLLTAALVTFLTASLVTAVSVVAVFRVAHEFAGGAAALSWPLFAALSYGLATTILAYSGIAWHDTLATGYLTIALYLVVLITRSPDAPKSSTLLSVCAGALLGLTVTTSMLPFFPAVVVALYFTATCWKRFPAFLAGGLLGLTPLLIYNTVCFGNPLLVPNLAGHYGDTFFRPAWANFFGKLSFYTRMVTLYVPIFWLGLIGLVFYPVSLRREQRLLFMMLLALAAYVLNIEASGTCQYGPRYLLSAMPLISLGLVGFSFLRGETQKLVAGLTASTCFVASCFINVIGAAHGAMLCDFPHSAVVKYLSEMLRGQMHFYPLAAALALPLSVCVILFVFMIRRGITTSPSGQSLPPFP
jgi:hypothetical protein